MQLPSQNRQLGDGEIEDPQPSNIVQEDWEDVSDVDGDSPCDVIGPGPNGPQVSSTVSLRRTRRATKTTFHASPTPTKSIRARKRTPIVQREEIEQALTHGVRYTASYGFDIFKGAIERISQTALCVPIEPPPIVNFEKLAHIQGSTFEQLAGESAGSSDLSIQVLRAEMATEDLSLLVRYSDLKSKENIADMLHTIGTDAKKTGRGLSKLDAKVVGAIDEVMAMNNYAMATIESAEKKAPSPLVQAIVPFKLGPTAEEIVAEAFTLAMSESEQAIGRLIVEAEVSSQNLDQLDADLWVLHEMIRREDDHTTREMDELLGELWTRLGGNKKAIRDYGDRLGLLNSLGEYRRRAVAHVRGTLHMLRTMSDDMEVLRERVAAPGLLESKIPLQVHVESIRNGLERLQEGRRIARGRGVEETVKMLLNVD